MRWFERAVSGGLVEAKVNLGVVYLWGFGVRKDLAFSAQLFQEAAEKGNGLGACYLGDMYYFGHGMPKDDAAAKHWYEAGTKLHDPLAEYRLGVLLSNHLNDQHDMKKAAQLFRDPQKQDISPLNMGWDCFWCVTLIWHPRRGKQFRCLPRLRKRAPGRRLQRWRCLRETAREVSVDKKLAYYHFLVAKLQSGQCGGQSCRK